MSEYDYHFWRRKYHEEAQLLGALSARSNHAIRAKEVNSRAAQQGSPFEMLEPYDGKLSRTVLLGGKRGASPLPYPVAVE